jgi:anion-transporting  ArsA/GET3 family ATPase
MAADEHSIDLPASKSTDAGKGPIALLEEYPSIRKSRFFTELYTRLVIGRDANIVITASSETGVGKSTLAVTLALLIDQHGWTADKAAIGSAAEYDKLYDSVNPGSVVVLDEAEEAVDSRRGMTSESVSLAQSFAAKRYKQVFSILTAPTKSWIDKRLGSDSADFWIQAEETDLGRIKGEGPVYRLKTNEHYERDFTKRTEKIAWPDISDHKAFAEMDRRKAERYDNGGEGEKQYFDAEEVAAIREETKQQTRKEYRSEIAQQLDEIQGLTQSDIGRVFDISRSRVTQIVNSDD